MTSNLRKDIDFKGLFRKLGHNLGEIRVRALESILSKLDHGLVCDEDFVHEKQLYIRLLEWFNLSDCTQKEEVLCLLNRLTQHSVGSRLLQDIGGVEFLTQLRSDIEPCHRPIIDQILESAMHLPDLASESQAPECIYQRPSDSAVWGASLSSAGDGSRLHMSQNNSDHHQHHHHHHHLHHHNSNQQQQGFFGSPHPVLRGHNNPVPTSTPSATSLNPSEILQPLGTPDSHLFRLSTFPWLPLTQTDQQVIASTNGSLQTKDSNLLISACEFLGDVVFQDFPAEIFLQRPEILKSLLSLVSLPSSSDIPVVVQACKTLTTFTKCLQARIRFFQDPVYYTSKQEFNSTSVSGMSSSTASSSHVVPPPSSARSTQGAGLTGWGGGRRRRGDGQDGDSSTTVSQDSSVGLEPDSESNLNDDLDLEDIPLLQSQQLTLPQLCVAILQRSLPRLRTSDQATSVAVLGLVQNTLTILVCVVGSDVWAGTSDSARDVADRLTDCLETISELLEFHHHSRHNVVTSLDPELGELSTHRVLYMGLVYTFTKFLTMIPLDKMKAVIPERLKSSLCSIVFDESLASSDPHPRAVALAICQALDLSTSADFQLSVDTCRSLTHTCNFCLHCDDGVMTTPITELSDQAEKAIASLPYHLHIPFVQKFVKFMSKICSKKKTSKETVTQCTNVLLSLLAYPIDSVRQACYVTVTEVIKQSLQVSKATAPKSKDSLQSKFLMNPDLLYQIVSFGLADSLSSVRDNSTSILHHLLSSQLLMSEALWQEFMIALTKSLPILQSYTDQNTPLGRKLLSMLEPTTSTHNIPLVEKLRGCLRLLLLADKSLRLQASKHIRWFLSNQQDKDGRLPVDPDLLTLEHCITTKVTQMLDDGQSRSLFTGEGMTQVYDIFTSNPVDPEVKKSAGEQLAIMMKDPRLHASFRERGGLGVVCSVIQQVTKSSSSEKGAEENKETLSSPRSNLPACLSILKNLTHHDYSLRHTLARDSDLLCCLVRVSLLHPTGEDIKSDVSQMFTLLLFDEVAKFDISPGDADTPGTRFSLPAEVIKRYRLPFKPSCHHVTSPNQVTLADERSDVMSLSGPREMMKISWNVAWQGGLDLLLDSMRTRLFSETKNEFSQSLVLTSTECTVLEQSGVSWKLEALHRSIKQASSHQDVETAIDSMWLYASVLQHMPCLLDFFSKTDWYSVLDRFLSVPPTSETDQSLLTHIMHFLTSSLQCVSPHDISKNSTSSSSNPALVWLTDKLFAVNGPMVSLINRGASGVDKENEDSLTSTGTSMKRLIDKEILAFVTSLHCQLPYQLCLRTKIGLSRGSLVKKLQDRLNITEAPHFYNLASLEGVLNCLMNVTARPGWSKECSSLDSLTLCSQLLNSLLEVVWSFHVGRGGSSRSYMGKGVTKATALCLRHLAYEMIQNCQEDTDWVKNWLYSSHDVNTQETQGLNWMLTLWAYRDPEVRAAGLGIAVAMASSEVGRLLVTSQCKHIPGGIWGSAFSIMLDPLECSLVCQQAAMLLVNLTSQSMPSGDLDPMAGTWQGPMVTDADYQSVVVGVKALEALLEHTNLFSIVSTRIASLHTSAFIQPVLVTMETPFNRLESSTSNTSTSSSTSDFATSSVEKTARTGLTNVSSVSGGHFTARSKTQSTEGVSMSSSSSLSASSQPCIPHASAGEDTTGLPSQSVQAFHLTNQHQEGVASASFVSALVKLLSNLVTLTPHMSLANMRAHSLLSSLVGLVKPQEVQKLIQEFSSEQTAGSPVALALRDVMEMYSSIAHLLTSCVISDTTSRLEVLSNQSGLTSLASLLLIIWSNQDDIADVCANLSTRVLQLFAGMLHTQGLSTLNALTPALGPIWPSLTESMCTFLSDSSLSKAKTLSASLDFVALLCCEEAKSLVKNPDRVVSTATISELLDAPLGEENSEEKLSELPTTGKQLCKVLVGAFEALNISDRSGIDSRHRLKVISAFKSLLAISQTAKAYALEAGMAETLVEHLKQTHAQLNLETLGLGKGKGKKEEVYLKEIALMFDLVRNFMCGNSDVKIACHHSGLTAVIQKMWSWCLQDHALMTSTLNLLVAYSAHCNSAASSFTSSPSSEVKVQASAPIKPSGPQGCILLYVLKVAQSHIQREECSPTLRLIFTILSNVAMNSDCRNLLWKNPFLQQVSQLNPRKSKIRVQVAIDILWCQLLLSLSFSIDGQQLILKIPEILTVLVDLVEAGSSRCRQCAILVVRNLCCHAPNKPKLLAVENFVGCLVGQIEQKSDEQSRLVATSALHALVHNNHKAKVQVKSSKVTPRILDTLHNINNGGQRSTPVIEATCQNLKAIIDNIRE